MTHRFQNTVKNPRKNRSFTRIGSWILSGSLGLLILSQSALAVTSQGAKDVGGLLGATWANQNVGSHISWGLTGHYNIMDQVNIGLYYDRFTNDTQVTGGTKFTTSYNLIAAEGNYLFADALEGAYLGGKLGWSITSVDLPNVSDRNNVVFGPSAGYDYMLGNGVSIGGQFNILWITLDPMVTTTSLLAVLKFNFL